jgi:hypothetical protein
MVRVMIAQLKHRLFAISESVRSGVHCKVKTVVHGSDVYEESDDSSAQTCGESAREESIESDAIGWRVRGRKWGEES